MCFATSHDKLKQSGLAFAYLCPIANFLVFGVLTPLLALAYCVRAFPCGISLRSLKVDGMVDNPLQLSLAQLRAMPKRTRLLTRVVGALVTKTAESNGFRRLECHLQERRTRRLP